MGIPVSAPVSQPAANFTQWWINSIQITAPSPTAQANARVLMTPFDPISGLLQQGHTELFVIADLFGAASTNSTTGAAVTTAISSILNAVESVAASRGIL